MEIEEVEIGEEYKIDGVGFTGSWTVNRIEKSKNESINIIVSKAGKQRIVSPDQIISNKKKKVVSYVNTPTINGYVELKTKSGRAIKIVDAWNLPLSKRGRPRKES